MIEHLDGRRIEHAVSIAAPLERVWPVLVDPVKAGHWMGGTVTLDPRPGGAARFDWGEQGAVEAHVIALDPPHRLVLDWDGYPDAGTTRVVFALTPDGHRTALALTHSGYGDGAAWDDIYEGEKTGWVDLLDALRRTAEGGSTESDIG